MPSHCFKGSMPKNLTGNRAIDWNLLPFKKGFLKQFEVKPMNEEEIKATWFAHTDCATINSEISEYQRHCDRFCGKFPPFCNDKCEIPQILAILRSRKIDLSCPS